MGRTPGVQLGSVPWALVQGAVAPGSCLGPQTPWCPWGPGACGPSSWAQHSLALHPAPAWLGVHPATCPGGPDRQEEHGVGRAGQCQPVWEVGGDAENTRGGGPVRLAWAAGWSAGPPFCFWGGDSAETEPLEPVLVGGSL